MWIQHITFIFSSLWKPGDWFKEITGLDKLEDVYDKLNDFQKSVLGYLEDMRKKIASGETALENISSTLSDEYTKIKDIAETLTNVETYGKKSKEFLDTMDTTLTNLKGTMDLAKDKLINIESYTGYLEEIQPDISSMKSGITKVKDYLSDIKTKISDNLPQLSKLDKLDQLTTINESIESLQSSIANIQLDIPETLTIDDTKIVEKLQELNSKFEVMGTKLDLLEKINQNMERQTYSLEYGVNLLRQNIPLTQNFLTYFDRLNKINELGIKTLRFEVTPLEYFDQLNNILTQSLELSIPEFTPPTPEYKKRGVFDIEYEPVKPIEPVKELEIEVEVPDIVPPSGIGGTTTTTTPIKTPVQTIDTTKQQNLLISGSSNTSLIQSP